MTGTGTRTGTGPGSGTGTGPETFSEKKVWYVHKIETDLETQQKIKPFSDKLKRRNLATHSETEN